MILPFCLHFRYPFSFPHFSCHFSTIFLLRLNSPTKHFLTATSPCQTTLKRPLKLSQFVSKYCFDYALIMINVYWSVAFNTNFVDQASTDQNVMERIFWRMSIVGSSRCATSMSLFANAERWELHGWVEEPLYIRYTPGLGDPFFIKPGEH